MSLEQFLCEAPPLLPPRKIVRFFIITFFEKSILNTETEGKAFAKIHVLLL